MQKRKRARFPNADSFTRMRFEIYDHYGAMQIIASRTRTEVEKALSQTNVRRPVAVRKLRASILERLSLEGWPNNVRVDPTNSRITITSTRHEVGLCLQTGNMSRVYADLLKLQTLFANHRIVASICIVPKKTFSNAINSNVVNFERFTNELNIFSKTVTVPMLVYGIEE